MITIKLEPLFIGIFQQWEHEALTIFFSISDRNESGNQLPWMKAQASAETTRLSRSVDININRYLKHEFEEKTTTKNQKLKKKNSRFVYP